MERQAATGNEREFLQLVEPVLPLAHRLAVGLLRSPYDADDAGQSALPKAWRPFVWRWLLRCLAWRFGSLVALETLTADGEISN